MSAVLSTCETIPPFTRADEGIAYFTCIPSAVPFSVVNPDFIKETIAVIADKTPALARAWGSNLKISPTPTMYPEIDKTAAIKAETNALFIIVIYLSKQINITPILIIIAPATINTFPNPKIGETSIKHKPTQASFEPIFFLSKCA